MVERKRSRIMAKLSKKVSEAAGKLVHKPKKSLGGKSVDGNSLSDTKTAPWPTMSGRGVGSSYAMAVKNVMNEARGEKGSDKNEYLGKQKQTMEYKQDKPMLFKGKGKKLKQGDNRDG